MVGVKRKANFPNNRHHPLCYVLEIPQLFIRGRHRRQQVVANNVQSCPNRQHGGADTNDIRDL